jgi:hypothetical protein
LDPAVLLEVGLAVREVDLAGPEVEVLQHAVSSLTDVVGHVLHTISEAGRVGPDLLCHDNPRIPARGIQDGRLAEGPVEVSAVLAQDSREHHGDHVDHEGGHEAHGGVLGSLEDLASRVGRVGRVGREGGLDYHEDRVDPADREDRWGGVDRLEGPILDRGGHGCWEEEGSDPREYDLYCDGQGKRREDVLG